MQLSPESIEMSLIYRFSPDDERYGSTIMHTFEMRVDDQKPFQHNLIVGDESSGWKPVSELLIIGDVTAAWDNDSIVTITEEIESDIKMT